MAKVKRYEAGVLRDPITITQDMTVREVIELQRAHKISGLPVVEGKRVVGIVTNRDLRFETRLDPPVRDIMTPRERLVTVREGATLDEAQGADAQAPPRARAGRSTATIELRGLITVKDITKATEHPNAVQGRAGQAAGRRRRSAPASDSEERVELMVRGRASTCSSSIRRTAITQGVLDRVRWVKKKFPKVEVVGGNIATADGGACAGRCGRRRRQGRHRPGLDLHDAHRRRRRRAADHRDRRTSPKALGGTRRAGDRRRRHPLFGRRREGARRRRALR